MELFRNVDFDFLGKKWWFILPSLALIVAGVVSIVAHGGFGYGVDFRSGVETTVRWDGVPPVDRIREALSLELQGVSVVAAHDSHGANEVLISTGLAAGGDLGGLRQTVERRLSTVSTSYSIRDFQVIGPQIGEDLRREAVMASAGASGGMLLYLSYRFRLAYGAAAVLAMAHDAIITIGALSLLHEEISLSVVAALLTLIGYSMNDTIVVFDRIRENRRLGARESLADTINRSINQTLSRTVLTSGLTLLTAVSLLMFGGPVLHGFSLTLVIGIVVGTFSSIFIASPILLAWEQGRPNGKRPAASLAAGGAQ